MAQKLQRTTLAHASSPDRTAGVSGSLVTISGSSRYSAGRCMVDRMATSWVGSLVIASHLPVVNASFICSAFSNVTGSNFRPFREK